MMYSKAKSVKLAKKLTLTVCVVVFSLLGITSASAQTYLEQSQAINNVAQAITTLKKNHANDQGAAAQKTYIMLSFYNDLIKQMKGNGLTPQQALTAVKNLYTTKIGNRSGQAANVTAAYQASLKAMTVPTGGSGFN